MDNIGRLSRSKPFELSFVLLLLTVAPLAAQSDGALDTAFGFGDGIAIWGAPAGASREIAGIAPHVERLYVYGHLRVATGPTDHFAFMGLAADGSQSNYTCDSAGTSIFDIPLDSVVASRAEAGRIDSSGHLLLGGWLRLASTPEVNRPFVARFRTNALGCALDLAYSDSGWEFFDDETWCDDEDCSIEELVEIVPATGAVAAPRTVALVRAEAGLLSARYFLLGLTAAGDVDTDFGTDGWAEVAADLAPLVAGAALAVDPRGRLWVQVSYYQSTMPVDDSVLHRFSAAGALGSTFTVAGSDSQNQFTGDLAISHDGDPIASFENSATAKSVWTRYESTGDAFVEDFSPVGSLWQLAVQGDGRVFAAADGVADGVLAMRLNASVAGYLPLAMDDGFGVGGLRQFDIDLPGSNSETVTSAALWHGRPIVAGTATTAASTTWGFVARLTNAYIFTDGFEGSTPATWAGAAP